MLRQIIRIDENKCNGCGLCVSACNEGAIGLAGGKARLLREDYCDGLGNCLPACPTGAITFEERDAPGYNESEVKKHMLENEQPAPLACGCPGADAKAILHGETAPERTSAPAHITSQLKQWPVQIRLAPVNAPYFENANLLIAADCAAYTYGGFHQDYMRSKITLIGCPKLDDVDYSDKLTAIIKENSIKSVTVVRMEVPCCGGIEYAAKAALQKSGKMIPWQVVTFSVDGRVLD